MLLSSIISMRNVLGFIFLCLCILAHGFSSHMARFNDSDETCNDFRFLLSLLMLNHAGAANNGGDDYDDGDDRDGGDGDDDDDDGAACC